MKAQVRGWCAGEWRKAANYRRGVVRREWRVEGKKKRREGVFVRARES